jgi:hypothetical protein
MKTIATVRWTRCGDPEMLGAGGFCGLRSEVTAMSQLKFTGTGHLVLDHMTFPPGFVHTCIGISTPTWSSFR